MPTPPSSQKNDQRPISFVLHDTAAGAAPFTFPMIIRPEDLTRTEPSRMSVHQVFGGDGGFVDSFGPGLASVQIAGHTGWRGNQYDDGLALFQRLHTIVFQEWHAARARAVAKNQDPDLVKLIFVDALDEFQWVCAPQQFTLRRSKSRPLLAQFNIVLVRLADDVADYSNTGVNGAGAPTSPVAAIQQSTSALSSLQGSIATIAGFATSVQSAVGAALGVIQGPLASLTTLAQTTLSTINSVVKPALALASQVSAAATQVTTTLAAIESLPETLRGELLQVSSAFRNAFCLVENVFSRTLTYPDYSPFFGGSNCSSTWPGGQVSQFSTAGTSGLAALFPPTGPIVAQTPAQSAALRNLAAMDVVLNPQTLEWMAAQIQVALNG